MRGIAREEAEIRDDARPITSSQGSTQSGKTGTTWGWCGSELDDVMTGDESLH
jgi:hypothetical protein